MENTPIELLPPPYCQTPVVRCGSDEIVKDEKYYQEVRRKQIASLALKGAKLGNIGKMCGTCAFKLDSDANLEPHNVESAWECLAYGGQFNCHKEIGVDKGCECVGFKYAKAFFETIE